MIREKESSYYDIGGISTLDVIKAKLSDEQFIGFLLGNTIKYACRMFHKHSEKGLIRDAEKLSNYSQLIKTEIDNKPDVITDLPTFTILVGNVGTGKSTYATECVTKDMNTTVVDRDSLVTMIAGGMYEKYDEHKKDIYLAAEESIILTALQKGFPVVLDRTNETLKSRKKYIDLVKDKAEVLCCDFGHGTEYSLKKRLSYPRGGSKMYWTNIHKKIAENYEKPHKKEGILKVFTFLGS